MADPDWMKDIRALVGKEYGRVYGWDPVNAPMARQWAEVMGLDNPAYADGSAIPPASAAMRAKPPQPHARAARRRSE